MEEKSKIEERIRGFKLDPEYRNERQIQKLIRNLSEIQTLARALNDTCEDKENDVEGSIGKISQVKTTFWSNDLSLDDPTEETMPGKACPICFDPPKTIYNCITCENLICGNCTNKLTTCPSCRSDFEETPPRRNKTAELFL